MLFAGLSGDQSRAGQDTCVLMASSQSDMEEWVKSIRRVLGSTSGGNRQWDQPLEGWFHSISHSMLLLSKGFKAGLLIPRKWDMQCFRDLP